MLWLFLLALIIFCFALLIVLGIVSFESWRKKRRSKKALLKAKPVFSEYKYIYRNIKEN